MPKISNETVVPLTLGVIVLMCSTVWFLSATIIHFKRDIDARLTSIEGRIGGFWSYNMEKESWYYVEINNPGFKVPDIPAIRQDNE